MLRIFTGCRGEQARTLRGLCDLCGKNEKLPITKRGMGVSPMKKTNHRRNAYVQNTSSKAEGCLRKFTDLRSVHGRDAHAPKPFVYPCPDIFRAPTPRGGEDDRVTNWHSDFFVRPKVPMYQCVQHAHEPNLGTTKSNHLRQRDRSASRLVPVSLRLG